MAEHQGTSGPAVFPEPPGRDLVHLVHLVIVSVLLIILWRFRRRLAARLAMWLLGVFALLDLVSLAFNLFYR